MTQGGGGTCITVSYGNRLAEAAGAAGGRMAQSPDVKRQGIEQLVRDPRVRVALEAAKRELAFGNRTAAVRLARESTGIGLREAQDLVASWEKKG